MPKYTVQNGSVVVLVGDKRVTKKIGEELDLSTAEAAEMDPEKHYLCLSSKYAKVKAAKVDEEDDEDELEKLTKPDSKPSK